MASETLANRYASAVFALAAESKQVERVADDLAMLERTIDGDPTIRGFFVSPVVQRSEKERALHDAFNGRVGEIALHTLLLLVRKRRESLLGGLVTEYRKIAMAARGVEPLTITTARELGPAEVRAIVERLEQTYGKKFEARVKVDPALIGGVRIAMGDRAIDGSVAGRLEELTRTLMGAGS